MPRLRRIAVAVATLDVLAGLAKLARQNHYVCPEIDTSKEIDIEQGRHPVLEVTLADSFVANDLYLRPGQEMIIITGPNMAGKSTYIRQAALMVLLAQIGSFLPAKRVRNWRCRSIFTRIGAGDEIARGQSTFMVEMVETANILNNASERSFIALDEIGRGTSTSMEFPWPGPLWNISNRNWRPDVIRYPLSRNGPNWRKFLTIFAITMSRCREWGEEIAFLYKIVEGSADKSYGLHVARLAGIPKQIIKRGKAIMANLESMPSISKAIPGVVAKLNQQTVRSKTTYSRWLEKRLSMAWLISTSMNSLSRSFGNSQRIAKRSASDLITSPSSQP